LFTSADAVGIVANALPFSPLYYILLHAPFPRPHIHFSLPQRFYHPEKRALFFYEFIISTILYHFVTVEDNNPVGHFDGGEAVANDDCRAVFCYAFDVFKQFCL
jgi:hypothetical protein